ncbi:MAG: 1,4-dihydroxy-2-naphthoate polyprenyltransferase [Acidimicrobiia bacterium]|nr:1,4-dihydroxy-2-naphthoate polyprenyltransferase [bacterium]MXZ31061.1 1,4-dihydroxy-2-naphthoate polyprenyltransferase [Acidimicrobiia bacterium]MYB25429.1 1,4-dihydroxy-2-naphthoate polyprenyltransferase [Acidimicrobiia bacterium]MYJ14395.1 1,4-dihydroxy-2-naphthoate polyprenyltransferase [Acidimicrobiia bacterium]
MTRARDWIAGARPRTLPASLAPVIAGTAAAARPGFGWGQGVIWWRLAMALVVALALQVGVNFANDYSDGLRGADDGRRVGPRRLVGSGLARPDAVRNAAALAGLVAAGAGAALAAAVGWELVAVGAACLAAGWYYSGGRRPYGYRGLGEVSVFVFFGLVAAVGAAYVHLEAITARSVWVGVGCGCLSCALLVVNNLRDIAGDAVVGKRTLAVRIGAARTRLLYVALVAAAFAALAPLAVGWEWPLRGVVVLGRQPVEPVTLVPLGWPRPWALLGFAALPLAVGPLRRVLRGAEGRELIGVLGATGRLLAAYGVAVAAGLWTAAAL